MTVLPYIVVSLTLRLGSFTFERAAQVARHGTMILILLWGVAFATVVLLPLSLPDWEAGTFFSASLIETSESFDFLDLYIPKNPFGALADNIVPAAVVFSILTGIALIPLRNKRRLLDPLEVVSDALGNIAQAVVRLSPWGTFALAAGAAGTTSPGELIRLGGYVGTFTIGVLLLTVVLFPALIVSLTPIGYRELMGRTRGTLLTALATGKMFAVLPMITNDVRELLASHGATQEEATETADVLVPLAYPFPNAGKILAILFIPFAAWFTGRPLGAGEYPMLLSVGLLSFFGSPVVAIPFLLGLFHLPADLIALFIVSGIWGARVGDVLGVMHLTAFSLLTASSERGWLRIRSGRILAWSVASVAAIAFSMWLNNTLVGWSISVTPAPRNRVAAMQSFFAGSGVVGNAEATPNPSPRAPDESVLQRIERTGTLRAGYLPKNPPFTYRNESGALVGFDVDLAYRLAIELSADLVLVPYDIGSLQRDFAHDHFDLAIGGRGSFVREADAYLESDSYLELHVALVVPDYRTDEFRSIEQIRGIKELRLAIVEGGMLVRTGRHRMPGIEVVSISSPEEYLRDQTTGLDALLTTAETGAIYTMVYPEFSVIVPEGLMVRVPVVVAVARDDAFHRTVNRFMQIKRADGTVEALHEHWILGGAAKSQGRRWSVARDVLGWGD